MKLKQARQMKFPYLCLGLQSSWVGFNYSIKTLLIVMANIDSTRSYLETNDILSSLGYRYHTVFRTFHCLHCQYAVYPSHTLSHAVFHDIIISDISKVEAVLSSFKLAEPTQVNQMRPAAGGPPVEGLQITDGFKCALCDYSAGVTRSISNHYKVEHPDFPCATANHYVNAKVQCFWQKTHTVFFTINPILLTLPSTNPYSVYIQKHYRSDQKSFTTPNLESRNYHPLIRMAGWHVHLEPYMKTTKDIGSLVNLCMSPQAKETTLSKLQNYVIEYLSAGVTAANGSHYLVRRMLHHYPMCVIYFYLNIS